MSSPPPDEASIIRLVGAVPFERKDDRATRHCYMQVEPVSKNDTAEVDRILGITTKAARSCPLAIAQVPPP